MTTIEVLPLSAAVSEVVSNDIANNDQTTGNNETMPNNGQNNETMPDNGSNNSDNGSNNADNAAAKKRGRPFGAKDGVKRKPYVRRPAPVVADVVPDVVPNAVPDVVSRQRKQTMQTKPETKETMPETMQPMPETMQTMPETMVSPSLPEPSARELIYQYHVKKKEREEAQWTTRISSMMVRPVR